MSEWKTVQATPRRRKLTPVYVTPTPKQNKYQPEPTSATTPTGKDEYAPPNPKTRRKMAVEPDKTGTSNRMNVRSLMNAKNLHASTAPSTLDVIVFKRDLVNALIQCPARNSKQGHSYLLEGLEEYRTRIKEPEAKPIIRPKEPDEPDDEDGDWTIFKYRLSKYERCEHYEAQALTILQETFPDCLQALKVNEFLPTTLTLKQAMAHLYDQVKDSDATRNSHMEIYDRFSSKGRSYKPNANGPREFFAACDDDRALARAIGLNNIDVTTIMIRALAAFRDSGHSRESLRNIEERWKLKLPQLADPETRYTEFKTYYTKELKVLFTDIGQQGRAFHANDDMMERVQAMEFDMRTLAADQDDLESAFHTARNDEHTKAPVSTLDIPPATDTVGTTMSDSVYKALMTRLDAIEKQTAQRPSRQRPARQYKYYCYTHGINQSHDGRVCKNPRQGHKEHPEATRCNPCGGSTRHMDRWMKWPSPNGFSDTNPN
jgi:hypothetical protein